MSKDAIGAPMIRLMTIADYDAVYHLWAATPGMGLRSLDDTEAGIRKFLARNPSTCFVAEESGVLTGVILSGHDGRRGYIYHLAVLPASRGRGLGTQLLDAACEALKAEGVNKAALVVFKSNQIGNDFWEARGWQVRDDLNYRNLSLNESNS